MSRKLELVREEKLFRLLPGRRESGRLEASGVALVDDKTALVVFDNLNQVARIDLSLKRRASNRLLPAPSLGSGFEDIAIDHRYGRAFCLIEAMEDFDGFLRGFVAEYDRAARFLRCTRLHTRFEETNKGFEGLAHVWRGGREYLYALCEGNLGTGRHAGGGRVDVFIRARDGGWKASHRIRLPKQAEFKDYAALAYRDQQLAIVSQASARLWVARVDEEAHALCRDPTPSIASRARATAMSRESPGCPVTPWSPSPTGRRGGSPLAAPRRIRASIYSGSQRAEVFAAEAYQEIVRAHPRVDTGQEVALKILKSNIQVCENAAPAGIRLVCTRVGQSNQL